ncbi:lipoprotein-releasing ABC transporter permease subunit [Natronospira bacteriovora]|uniref:Lipoprotein-releasing ABC transporter permease subunit n=1 Tax=Natronospira bacteriovora TaxID=3069753 RepID=A0ABU0W2S7_9GAMM|nr:lipoprotein-releasing ABC transporter permease subunit [Natronospira sp. AB-CW4]MDQ2068264.1 lipoprotein-releasing ABC transporter permease subunit [Natronospira sp. AB-CW4]
MFRPYEIFVGLRYLRAKRRNHFISFISLTSVLGITVGVMALITVMSVMNGFEKELRERILGMVSHASITSYGGRIEEWENIRDRIIVDQRVLGAAPFIEKEGMLARDGQLSGGMVRGILPEHEPSVSDVGEKMIQGDMSQLVAGEYRVILGSELARALRVGLGDRVFLLVPEGNITVAGFRPRMRRFEVVGLFEVGMYEYDRSHAFIHLDDARNLYRFGDEISGLRLKLDDMFRAPAVARDIAASLGRGHFVRDWTRQHANFFAALQIEKTVMFIILFLIVAVAAFNIISTLVMVVNDKRSDIAVLRTIGSTPRSIMAVFIVQGTVIGFVGTLLGLAFGVTLALNVDQIVPWLEELFQTEFLPADVYYISDLPSELRWPDVGRIAGIAFTLSVLSTLYPAWRASRTQPAEALRYE